MKPLYQADQYDRGTNQNLLFHAETIDPVSEASFNLLLNELPRQEMCIGLRTPSIAGGFACFI